MTELERAWSAISRRRFLQGASLGIAALGVAAVSRSKVTRAASGSPSPAPDPQLAGNLSAVTENWAEPVVWRPIGNDPLGLRVVENENGLRFSYGGVSPGPTIRMSGDQTLYVHIQNDMGPDEGTSPVGPNPDAAEGYPGPEGAMLQTLQGDAVYGDGLNHIPTEPKADWALGEHLNGVHSAHVTNLHTHGLHVAPGMNDNGTSSDDIFLRIVPAADAKKISQSPELYREYQEDRDEIIDSVADFEFRLGNVMQSLLGPDGQPLSGLPHPPGTYWYHPHSHGATQNQVASGMAGFLIIEGDVDSLLNERIAGDASAQWDVKTGPWEYRERSMLLQRVFLAPTANVSGPSAGPDPDKLKKKSGSIVTVVNGQVDPDVITMHPGAIERWRVLNGSVDGAGYMRLAVLVGEFGVDSDNKLVKVDRSGAQPAELPVTVNDYQPITVSVDGKAEPVEKAILHQLSWDGITRVVEEPPGSWEYKVRDLAAVNNGQEPDFDSLDDCYQAENMHLCYQRPNELSMADANRADVFFEAPALRDGEPQIYTVVSLPTRLYGTPESTSKIIAHVVVSGEHVPGSGWTFSDLLEGLDVHPYEIPVRDSELFVESVAERSAQGIGDEPAYRTRTIRYAGWGANGLPLVEVNAEYVAANPDKEKLTYYSPPPKDSTDYTLPVTKGDTKEALPVTGIERFPSGDLPTVLLPANVRTMNIDGEKFFPTSETTPRMLLDTSEEWVVYNHSLDQYTVAPPDSSWTPQQVEEYLAVNPELVYYQFDYLGDPPDGAVTSPQPYFGSHRLTYPMTIAQVAEVNAKRAAVGGDPWTQKGQLQLHGRGVDHPFHIHQNPFWLMRIDVPDQNGDYVNTLPQPRWADTVAVPRNGGRVVFRSRFVDFAGEFVEHCHLLLHEDNGMMQRLQVIGDAAAANYETRSSVVAAGASQDDVNSIYPQPSLANSWERSLLFIDQNNTGQVYPGEGFHVSVPTPPTE